MFDRNWFSVSHEDITRELANTVNSGFTDASGSWRSLAERLADISGAVARATTGIADTRSGAAADAAGRATSPLAPWADHNRTMAGTIGAASDEQAGRLADLRGRMPPPAPPGPSVLGWAGILGEASLGRIDGFVGEMAREQQAQDSERAAQQMMHQYQQVSSEHAGVLPQFAAPGATTTGGGGDGAPGPDQGADAPGGRGPGPGGPGPGGSGAGGSGAGGSGAGGPGASTLGPSPTGPGPGGPHVPGDGGSSLPPAPAASTPSAGSPPSGIPAPSPGPTTPGGGPNGPSTGGGAGPHHLPAPPPRVPRGPVDGGSALPGSDPSRGGSSAAVPGGKGSAPVIPGSPRSPAGTGVDDGSSRIPPSQLRPDRVPTGHLSPDGTIGAPDRGPANPLGGANAGSELGSGARVGAGGPLLEPAVGRAGPAGPGVGPEGRGEVPLIPPGVGGMGGGHERDHRRADYVTEDDPDAIAGVLPRVAPPVIGE